MYVNQINKTQFKGTTKFLCCNSEGKSRRISEYPYGRAYFGDTRGLSALVKKQSIPTAVVEETIGNLHNNVTYRVYITDPNETVVDSMTKLQHDYIVYDREPIFPNIYENFYSENLSEDFKNLQEYFKRLASFQSKNEKQIFNKAEITKKTELAQKCSQIYEECADLRTRKKMLEQKILANQQHIKFIEQNLPEYEKELERKNTILINNQKRLSQRENTLDRLDYKKYVLSRKRKMSLVDISKIDAALDKCADFIEKMTKNMEKLSKRINFLKKYIDNAPDNIKTYQEEIIKMLKEIEEIKMLIKPNFEKLSEFYLRNGIKIVK